MEFPAQLRRQPSVQPDRDGGWLSTGALRCAPLDAWPHPARLVQDVSHTVDQLTKRISAHGPGGSIRARGSPRPATRLSITADHQTKQSYRLISIRPILTVSL